MKVIALIVALIASAHAKSENVRNFKHDESLVRNYANITRLEDILNLFNLNKIGASWKELSMQVSRECSHDMARYLDGLEERKIWALKSKRKHNFCIIAHEPRNFIEQPSAEENGNVSKALLHKELQ